MRTDNRTKPKFRGFFFGFRFFSVVAIPTSVLVSVVEKTSVFGFGVGYRPSSILDLALDL